MFNVQGRKYAPVGSGVTDDSPLTVQVVHIINNAPGTLEEATWPPKDARMRLSKANNQVVVRAVRRHTSPQPASLEAVWSERAQPGEPRSPEGRAAGNALEEAGGGPPRSRKKGFKHADVRTIFTERDPRVKEESGEGHNFEPCVEPTWCDACCRYIFEHGLTCTGTAAGDWVVVSVSPK